MGRVEHGWKVRPDLCAIDSQTNPKKFLGHFWVDSLVHDMHALDLLMNTIGSKKICCGSDYPFPLGEEIPGELVENASYADAIKVDILWNNAMEWLK
ncbi:MAG: amidohydrolase family protein [Chitinophagaceae bacterium]